MYDDRGPEPSSVEADVYVWRYALIVVDCFVQCGFVGSQIAFSHVIRGHPGCLFQLFGVRAVRMILASASSNIRAICPIGLASIA